MSISITLPDGSVKQYDKPVSALAVATDISPRLADASICAELNGKLIDLEHMIDSDANLVLHTFKSEIDRKSVV
ncbi:MAG: TGS domain-containing protein [Candidatus Cloacimonetes bacterium]|nr:TGS domain-containing protein [Candidatus Cloacimonadota bacterium]